MCATSETASTTRISQSSVSYGSAGSPTSRSQAA
jgi:hypothetical protein